MLGRAPKRAPAGAAADADEQLDGVPGDDDAVAPPSRDETEALADAVTTLGSTVGGLRELIGADHLDTRARVSRLEERIVVLEHLVGRLVGATGDPPPDAAGAADDLLLEGGAEDEPFAAAVDEPSLDARPADEAPAAAPDARRPDLARLERIAASGGKRAAAARRKLAAAGGHADGADEEQRPARRPRGRRPDAPAG